MSVIPFADIKSRAIERLQQLDVHFTYHNIPHTLDVLTQAERIAQCEKITGEEDLLLLKTAAMYHDAGFLISYSGHEQDSCVVFREDAGQFGFTIGQTEIIEGLIMATRVPQVPEGILQEIICDADLDYLAREDFFELADGLRREFIYYGIVPDDAGWEALQLKFFEHHHYHTHSSIMQREPAKRKHFVQLLVQPA
jgi:predicted metal-dependent HD superfamily phosphohydrolase